MDNVIERFLKDIATHKITILRDDGMNRHIRFKKPDTTDMYFDLITWPGHLCYTGDMGTFVFSRIEDMFQFFRKREGAELSVSLGYWSEKAIAHDRCGIEKYSPEKFKNVVEEYFQDYYVDMKEAEYSALHERLVDEVLTHADDNEYDATRAAIDFEHEGEQVFSDFWETNLKEFTPRFVWCCYALQWGISVYDKVKEATEFADPQIMVKKSDIEEQINALNHYLHLYVPEGCADEHVLKTRKAMEDAGGVVAYITDKLEILRAYLKKE